jgi:hypothetical protein
MAALTLPATFNLSATPSDSVERPLREARQLHPREPAEAALGQAALPRCVRVPRSEEGANLKILRLLQVGRVQQVLARHWKARLQLRGVDGPRAVLVGSLELDPKRACCSSESTTSESSLRSVRSSMEA